MFVEFVNGVKDLITNKKNLINYVNILLIASIVAGLTLKFIISVHYPLNSDSVYAGLASREIWEYGNYFLYYYYTSQATPYYFTDIYTIQLIPQVLTGFNPLALNIMGFMLFCGIILIFSYLIYRISGNAVNSLLFAALVSSLPPGTYVYFTQIFHVGTVFFTGLVMILLFDFPHLKISRYLLGLAILLLTLFSDSLVFIWLIVPGVLYYAYMAFFASPRADNKRRPDLSGLWFVVLAFVCSVAVMISERTFIRYFIRYGDIHLVDFSTFLQQAAMFIERIVLLYQSAIYELFTSPANLNVLDCLCIVASVALVLYCAFKGRKNVPHRVGVFSLMAGVSALFFFAGTSVFQEVRYLLFPAVLVFVVISLCYRDHDTPFLAILFSILLLNTAASAFYISSQDTSPNREEVGLISFLQSRQLHYGIGDYWDANIITYLSREDVTVRPVMAKGDNIVPFRWLTADRWYEKSEVSKVNFIVIKNTSAADRPYLNAGNISPYLALYPPFNTSVWNNYVIYEYRA